MIWVLCKAEERAGVNASETYGSPNILQCALLPFVERLLFSGRKFASLNFEIVGVENRGPGDSQVTTRGYCVVWSEGFVYSIKVVIIDPCRSLALGTSLFPAFFQSLLASSSGLPAQQYSGLSSRLVRKASYHSLVADRLF